MHRRQHPTRPALTTQLRLGRVRTVKHSGFLPEWHSDGTHGCLAETVLESTHHAIVILDRYGHRIVYANRALFTTTGYSFEEVKGKPFPQLQSKRHNNAFYEQIWKSLEQKGHWFGEIWGRCKNGEDYPSLHTFSPIFDGTQGRAVYHVSVCCDITSIKRQQADVSHLAYHDHLTGLPNRLVLIDRLEHALRTHTRDNTKLAVLYVDLDGFKHINDTLGHAVGDRFLQASADRFRSILRSGDTVARVGGDEFVVLVESCPSRRNVALIAEKAIQKLGEPLHIAQHRIEVRASVGIAFFPHDGRDGDTILHAADQAMYHAKVNRGGSFCFFDQL